MVQSGTERTMKTHIGSSLALVLFGGLAVCFQPAFAAWDFA